MLRMCLRRKHRLLKLTRERVMITFKRYRPRAGGAVTAYRVNPMALVGWPPTAPTGVSPR